jgi:hypothetical protein
MLWAKMYQLGARGPIFDWLRQLYQRMRYTVCHDGQLSSTFKSTVGILTGDVASPSLWNILFSDLDIPLHDSDVELNGKRICSLEHADDVVMFLTCPHTVQAKLNTFVSWCSQNLTIISAAKLRWQIFSPIPSNVPLLTIDTVTLKRVHEFKYIGCCKLYFRQLARSLHLRENNIT